jgi:hypothetical protein
MRGRARNLLYCDSGNVAPIVALSLIGLIAAGGLAFDYARLASLDTELQNAADQAALAAASQLDREANACERAVAAANTLVSNQSLFANDQQGLAVTIAPVSVCNGDSSITFDPAAAIRFYQDKAKTIAATDDANARFVEVQVSSRTGNYALTPIVAAISTGARFAVAYAGMGSAICKVPPFMICNPSPGTFFNADNPPWDTLNPGWKGVGLKLFQGGGNSWAPGNFGYLDVGATSSGSPDQRVALAMNNPNTNCVADEGVEVDTGVAMTVLDALNVRFDLFQNGWPRNTCYPSGNCSPALNATKDIVRDPANVPAANSCGFNAANASGWTFPATADQYIPTNAAGDDATIVHMGYPMDKCHYPAGSGTCGTTNDRFGNGDWRRDLYFKTNHPLLTTNGTNWVGATGLPTDVSRFEVYRWEQQSTGHLGNTSGVLPQTSSGNLTQYGAAVCKPGLGPGPTQPDRRVVAAAVADNCAALSGGSTEVDVGAWIEVFLVQPSVDRPQIGVNASDIYVEIIGNTNPTDSGAVAQVVTRDVPFLVE